MSTSQQIYLQTESKMKKSLDRICSEFSGMRTGRASISLLDGIKVDCYNTKMPLNQVANLSTPDGRTIDIRPWDPSVVAAIEKSILASDLGLTPQSDGKNIRLNLPSLTEERRKEIVKTAKRMAEETRVHVRNERRQAMEDLKKMEKEKILSQDDLKSAESTIQKLTDSFTRKVDEVLTKKEKEILEV